MITKEFAEKLGLDENSTTEWNGIITTAKLDENQEKALLTSLSNLDAGLKNKYSKVANENAESILHGAAQKIEETTGFKREKGVKIADYFVQAGEHYIKSREEKLKEKEKELEDKIKNGNSDELLKKELSETKEKLEDYQKIAAEYDKIKDIPSKYDSLSKEFIGQKRTIAYSSIKPNFPDTVNPYEAKAIWEEFIGGIESKFDIEIVDGKAIAIDKENKFKQIELSQLVEKDEKIQGLLKGRAINGLNHKKNNIKIEGVPFDVPEGATSEEIDKLIREYLLNEKKIDYISNEYAQLFPKYKKLIANQKAK